MTTPNVADDPPDKAALATATIIPFPARPKAEPPASPDRLARALESLNAALADQQTAIAAWRLVINELKSTTTSLDDSLRRYRKTLWTLDTSVASLRAKARSLEQWADGVVAAAAD